MRLSDEILARWNLSAQPVRSERAKEQPARCSLARSAGHLSPIDGRRCAVLAIIRSEIPFNARRQLVVAAKPIKVAGCSAELLRGLRGAKDRRTKELRFVCGSSALHCWPFECEFEFEFAFG